MFIVPPASDWLKDVDARVQAGIELGKKGGFVRGGDSIVIVTGWKQGSGFTNTIRVVYVSSDHREREFTGIIG